MRGLIFLLAVIPLSACSEGFKSVSNLSSSKQCFSSKSISQFDYLKSGSYQLEPTSSVNHRDSFSQNKVQLHELNTSKVTVQKLQQSFLYKGDIITLIFDNSCVQESQEQNMELNRFVKPFKINKKINIESVNVEITEDISLSEFSNMVNNNGCVIGASNSAMAQLLSLPNDKYYSKQNHLPVIKYDQTYEAFDSMLEKLSEDIVIAVVDNGITMDHPDLKDILWENIAEKNGVAGVDDDGNGFIDDINGYDFAEQEGSPEHKGESIHGSHVAGLAAAHTNNGAGVSGVMFKKVKVMALNVFGKKVGASNADIENAIRYAADMGVDVINLSIGVNSRVASMDSAIRYAISKGVFVVSAAGNGNYELSESIFFSPGSFAHEISGMINVGAVDVMTAGSLCGFSNYSALYVEFAAPGCDASATNQGLLSTVSGAGYSWLKGTSMASPVFAGAAALVLGVIRANSGQNLTPSQLEDFMKNASSYSDSLSGKIQGNRLLDLNELLNSINEHYPSAVGSSPSQEQMSGCL